MRECSESTDRMLLLVRKSATEPPRGYVAGVTACQKPIRRGLLRAFAVMYAIQLAALAAERLWPPIDVVDGNWRYVVIRGPGLPALFPGIGVVPLLTGEPVQLTRTHVDTGEVHVETADLICDLVDRHPSLQGVEYGRRLLDPRR